MDRYIDLVVVRDFLEAAVEVLHVLDQKATRKSEVTLLILAVIYDVDHDTVLELEVLTIKHFHATFIMAEHVDYSGA